MVVAVSLNTCIDRTVEIDSFQYGGMNRIKKAVSEGSGKGVNVALAMRELGMEAGCIGFLPEENDALVRRRLDSAGCANEFVRVPGSVRVNTKVLDREKGIVTELNESGPEVAPQHLNAMLALMRRWEANAYVMTGSLPPGCPADFYRRLIECCNAPCLLDAEGQKLTQGLIAKPFLIKPNDYELELAVGRKLPEISDILEAAKEMVGKGAGMAAVSLGAKGAIFSDGNLGYYAPRIGINAKSTVGAGDCMVAGMMYAVEKGMEPKEIFRHGVAGGTAGCLTEGTRLLRKDDFFEMLGKVQIESV